MINELKKFWSIYQNYKLHPEDEKYLGSNKDQFCLDITIDELREKYGTDLKSDNTRESFLKDKFNKNKILTSLSVVPFFGDVENSKIYILMGNPGFHTGDYVDEIENKDYINLIEQNLKLQLKIGGILCIPVDNENGKQTMHKITRISETEFDEVTSEEFSFVPMLGGKNF